MAGGTHLGSGGHAPGHPQTAATGTWLRDFWVPCPTGSARQPRSSPHNSDQASSLTAERRPPSAQLHRL